MKRYSLFPVLVAIILISSCGRDSVKVIKVPDVEAVQVSPEGDLPDLLAPRAMSVSDVLSVIFESC